MKNRHAPFAAATARLRGLAVATAVAVTMAVLGMAPAPAGAAGACPGTCTIFDGTAPASAPASDPSNIELGVKFRSDANGWVTGVRFYKGAGNDGTHTGSLWDAAGNRLSTATFTGETAGGWQQVTFATPVAVTAGTTYVASYLAPNGHYSYDALPANGVDNPPLHALADGVDGGNGVFQYGGGFPAGGGGANYWVDVMFSTGPVITGFTPTSGPPGSNVTITGVGFTGLQSVNLNGAPVNVLSSTATTIQVRLNSWNTSGRFTVTLNGGDSATSAGTFTVTAPATCPGTCTIWSSSTTPGTAATSDPSTIELGVKFRTESNGWVTGVRFYKGAGNDGTHTGSLWDTAGNRLATATFTGETGTGWQQVDFSSPVAVTAGTTYVASYLAPNGHYAYDAFPPNGVDNPPLHALANGVDGGNGVFQYGGGFPAGGGGANYWVDVVFSTGAVATGFSPGSGPPGSTVTISGSALNLVQAVNLNGSPVNIVSKSSTTLVVKLNSWNTTGKFTLQTLGGSTLTVPGGNFTVTSPPPAAGPSITGFTPGSGPPGSAVTISGTNFANVNSVTLNGAPVKLLSWNATTIQVQLNSWNTTGKFTVMMQGGKNVTSTGTFTVT